MAMKAGYASPALRWGLLLEDHPGSSWEAAYVEGPSESGIPEQYGGGGAFCRVTIYFGPGSDHAAVTALKSIPAEGDPDDWTVLSTKTLGRALKKAGYPDDLPSLKALMHWRDRNAQVAAIGAGEDPRAALGPGGAQEADSSFDDAAKSSPDAIGSDDDDGEVLDLDSEEVGEPPTAETMAALRSTLGSLSRDGQNRVRAFAQDHGWRLTSPPSEVAADDLLAFAAEVEREARTAAQDAAGAD